MRLGGVGEEAGGLDDDVDAEVAPRQRGRVLLDLEGLDLGVADDDDVVALEADVLGVAAQDRVVLQQVRQAGVVGEVVDRDDLDVGLLPSAFCAARARKKLRPMRPKPLTPTRTVTCLSLFCLDAHRPA